MNDYNSVTNKRNIQTPLILLSEYEDPNLFIGVKIAKLAKTNKELVIENSNEIKNYIGDQMNRWGSK